MEATLDLPETENLPNEINKKMFILKAPKNNGLVLNIHHMTAKKHVRLIHCDFHTMGNLLVLASNEGKIFLIDFLLGRHWSLPKFDSVSCIKFSKFRDSELLVAKHNGFIEVVNVNSGSLTATLMCHKYAVNCISFADTNKCVSASKQEAVIWDMDNYCRIQVLLLEETTILKFVHFIPVSNHILACFQDDIIQIWQRGTFITLKQFLPSNWSNYSVKSVTFSQNGRIMLVSGYIPILAIFLLDNWTILKKVKLPDHIKTVKEIKLVSENFDGGCNRLLTILSGSGVIYFFDLERNVVLSEFKSHCEISSFAISASRCHYLACILNSGDAEVYETTAYTRVSRCLDPQDEEVTKIKGKTNLKLRTFSRGVAKNIKQQLETTLNTDRLKSIIKEYDKFPDLYRAIIWERILKLPNNAQIYNNIVNHVTIAAFEDLYCKFPLEDTGLIKCLRNLLNNVVTWCPFFANVEFLPFLLFPFAKIFHKRPVACFELCCTLIVNWCQHWFEYHPLPPVNVLAITENLLMEHDPDLLNYYSTVKMSSKIYSWSLLESAFSEVLTAQEWLRFWDHVIVNEPAFLICGTTAYNMLQRKAILLLNRDDIQGFFRSQRPIDIKKLISKTYYILHNTSEKNHPRQYLEPFKSLDPGSYPNFISYPQTVIDFQREQMEYLNHELKEIKSANRELNRKQKMRHAQEKELEIQAEESRRLKEVERACLENIKSFQANLKHEQEKLVKMKQDLANEEKDIIDNTRSKMKTWKGQQKVLDTKLINDGVTLGNLQNDYEFAKAEDCYLDKKMQILQSQRPSIKDMSELKTSINPDIMREVRSFQKETMRFREMLNKARFDEDSHIRNIEFAKQISMLNRLIQKIENKIQKVQRWNKDNAKIEDLETETQTLNKEILKIIKTINAKQKKLAPSDFSEFSKNQVELDSRKNGTKNVKFEGNSDTS